MDEKKKVCIVSTSQVDNYGAVLQAYALETILSERFDTKTLNYISPGLQSSNEIRYSKLWKRTLAKILFHNYYKQRKIKHGKFEAFRNKYLSLTEQYSLDQIYQSGLESKFDYFVSGSDQVFNPEIYKGEMVSFLDFVKNPDKKKTYAASIGMDAFLKKYGEVYSKHLREFGTLLIRETSSAKAIEKDFGIASYSVVDPVFLLTKDQWLKAFPPKINTNRKYILTYILGKDDNAALAIRDFAKNKNLEILNIAGTYGYPYKKLLGRSICPSPEEFLSLIFNAEYIYAKSFHGTAFSILFGKPYFYSCEDGDSAETRIKELENKFGLPSRRIIGGKIIDNDINWEAVNSNIDKWRKYSLSLLFSSLGYSSDTNDKYEPNVVRSYTNIQAVGDQCVGCENCRLACPTHAISCDLDEEGFLYPKIDKNCCIDCGKCLDNCPVINRPSVQLGNKCYAASKAGEEALQSSSGGIASALYDMALKNGWKAFGVKWKTDFISAEYFEIKDSADICLAKTSKYIQAAKGDCFGKIIRYLKSGEKVLFIGCPCEVSALKRLARKASNNLFTADLICHGPASRNIIQHYLKEKKIPEPIKDFCMRYKPGDGSSLNLKIIDHKGNILVEKRNGSSFGIGMDNILRPSCYVCHNRSGDLTIGDFWGLPNNDKGFSKNGTSVIIVNTEKGKEVFNELSKTILYEQEDIELAKKGNNTLNCPNKPFFNRVKLLKLISISNEPIKKLYKKCLPTKVRMKRCFPSFLKNFIKSILKRNKRFS